MYKTTESKVVKPVTWQAVRGVPIDSLEVIGLQMFKLEAATSINLGVLGHVAAVDLLHVDSLLFART